MTTQAFDERPGAARGGAPWDVLTTDPRFKKAWEVAGPAFVILVCQAVGQAVFYKQNPFSQPGLYLYGIILGLLGALVALGMALIYRANRILNFAQGELGLAPTVLAIDLIVYSGLPYVVSLFLGLAAAVILGGLVEVLIIRRFFKAPRLILTVATIGLSQLLTVAALAIPFIWGQDPISQTVVAPFDFQFEVSPITFRANHLLALVIAPLALAAVAIFLRYTNVGIAIRASAERSDRAYLLGIPVKRLQTLVWAIAATLSFVGVFLKAGVVGLPFVSNQGFGTTSFSALLIALAALTLGRFSNLPAIATSAVALGILEQVVIWNNGDKPAMIYPIFAAVILVGLAVRKTSQARTEHDTATSWQAADEIRPIPRELRRVPEVMAAKWGSLLLLAYLAYRLPTFEFMDSGMMLKASAVVVFAMVGVSIMLLTGWAGQVSLGQMGFVGVGAAVGALATKQWHLDLMVAVPLAGAAGAVVAVLVGLPALRVRGLFLAVTTLAFTITASNYLLNYDYPIARWIPSGHLVRPPLFGRIDLESQANMYYLCLASLLLTILAVSGLRRSRTGRVLLALRENERAAQAYGINLIRAKLMSFAISGFLAAAAGCLFVHVNSTFSPEQFGAGPSFQAFTSTVVGGLGAMTGAIMGAVFSRGGTWFLQGNWQLLPSAIGVLLVLLMFPSGLSGLFFRGRDRWLRSVATRNGIVVPSLLADYEPVNDPIPDPIEHAEHAVEEHVDAVLPVTPPGGAAEPASSSRAATGVDAPDAPSTVSTGGAP
jgi:branched-chain amino acid transport system permease protein